MKVRILGLDVFLSWVRLDGEREGVGTSRMVVGIVGTVDAPPTPGGKPCLAVLGEYSETALARKCFCLFFCILLQKKPLREETRFYT